MNLNLDYEETDHMQRNLDIVADEFGFFNISGNK